MTTLATPESSGHLEAVARPPSVVTLLSALLEEGAALRASDIHIDPVLSEIRVRLRVDGIIRDQRELPKAIHAELIARIKILASLRTDEHQAPQDGRFRFVRENGESFDIRVSVMATYHGENAVLRLLAESGKANDLISLGFSTEDVSLLINACAKRSGLILATGPTGSGKTTTLYSLIASMDATHTSIVTIEDPIEYAMPGVRQIAVKERAGLSFGTGLRSLLRQDPDAIMVGEIRDAETAGLAVNAALTGHLVLSTLHTTDGATVIPRLLDMKAEPYLVASTLSLIVAQRLVRKTCAACKGSGCDPCEKSGYRGRLSIYELLEINDTIRDAIHARRPAADIRKIAKENGMQTMLENGLGKAEDGLTTREEVLRAIHD